MSRRLHPGPGQTPEEVAADQRARLRTTLTEMVYERGYPEVTVRELVKRAHVSKPSFYRLYSGKEGCFQSAYDEAAGEAIEWVAEATRDSADRAELAARGLAAFCSAVTLRPGAAYLGMLEPLSVGGETRGRMRESEKAFAELLRQRFEEVRDGGRLPMPLARGIVSGIARIARERLSASTPDRFKDDIGDLREWLVAVSDPVISQLPTVARTEAPVKDRKPPRRLDLPMADERALLINATLRLAAEGGYEQLTAARVAAAAGVSKRSFEANFASVDDCFARTIEIGAVAAVAEFRAAYESADEWAIGIHRGLASLCRYFAAEPGMARLAFVEVYAPGRVATKQGSGILTSLAGLLRERVPSTQRPSAVSAEASVGAIWTVLRRWVAAGQGSQLPSLGATLSWLAIAPSLGGKAVVEIAQGGRGSPQPANQRRKPHRPKLETQASRRLDTFVARKRS